MSGEVTRLRFKAANRPESIFSATWLVLGTVLVLSCTTSTVKAAIVGTGDLSPSDPNTWNWIYDSYVGKSSAGTVTVNDGSILECGDTFLGYNFGSNGTVTVTDTGSKWNPSLLYVGYAGSGTLSIEAGGQVNNDSSTLGYSAGSNGAATITGAGSQWNSGDILRVGYHGSGTLTVNDGGTINVNYGLFASLSNLFGNGNIYTKGALLDADLVLDATHGLQNTLSFGTGGTLHIDFTDPKEFRVLGVGYKGNGTLRIADGIAVSSTQFASQGGGCLGDRPGSNGTATVTGAGSKWSVSGPFYVGNFGNGTLNIEAGGQVDSSTAYLGYDFNSTGTATITGTGSKWTNSNLYVGYYGSGTLNIEAGAQVSDNNASLGNSLGTATATVSGTGSKWSNSSSLYVGYNVAGIGTLNIVSGGLVTAKTLLLANTRCSCKIDSGTLQAGSITCGSSAANLNWLDGTIQNYDAQTNLTVANPLTLKLASTGTHAFNIDAGRTGTIDAVLSDMTSGGTLTKQGQGLLMLTGTNTYSGQTTVEAGRFKVTGSILNTSGMDVSAGATLELAKTSGSATAGSLAISNAGTILIWAGSQTVGTISGPGVTQLNPGATLTAKSIVQDSLFIGIIGAGAANVAGETVSQVPEPAMATLLACGLLAVAAFKWRRSK